MQKTVLITGAAGNLGRAVVNRFADEGYRVVAAVRPGSAPDLDKRGNVTIKEADLTDETSVEKLVAYTAAEGVVHAGLFLAGGFAAGDLAGTDGAALQKMMRLNFETTFHVARKVFTMMVKQPEGGRIVMVGSRQGLHPGIGGGTVAYALSKSLIFAFADLLNAEGASKNVVAHVVVPGTIDTPENRASMPGADFSKWPKPEEIADVMAFACSQKGAILRDTVLKVYGRS